MRPRTSRAGFPAVTAAVAMVLSGCVVAGTPVRETTDLTSLDVGYYSIDPLTEPAAPDEKHGRVLESVRMGEATIDPADADASLIYGVATAGAHPIPTPSKAIGTLSDPARGVLAKYGMLAGFGATGMDRATAEPIVGANRLLTVLLLRFPDAKSARQAAIEMDSADAAVSTENVGVPIPGFPDAHAHWRPTAPTLAASLAQDSFVISLLIGHTSTDLTAMTALAGRAFAAQRALLAGFRPTSTGDIAALRADRDGMLRRLLSEDPGHWPAPEALTNGYSTNAGWGAIIFPSGVVYGPRAVALRGPRPAKRKAEAHAFSGQSELLRYSDASTARRAYLGDFTAGATVQDIAGPTGVPEVDCVRDLDGAGTGSEYACVLLHGRYVALLYSSDEDQVRKKAAAQFVLLQRDPE
ncbi:DUF7373 family lipoprotein [Nocardia sp. NPDC003693]